MEALHNLLEWCAKQARVQLLEVCQRPQGFQQVIVKADETFYGISPEFDWKDLNSVQNATDAHRRGYLSQDFPNTYFERSHRIALDMLQRSNTGREGFEFYNGKLAKLKGISIEKGRSATDEILELTIGYTSYFTAIGTNIHFGGYQYHHSSLPPEPPLSQELAWPRMFDWRTALSKSPLANDLAVDLFLYNDWEILYVYRGRVGQQSGLCNSTINGAMEFSRENPDVLDGRPNIGQTAKRETEYEMRIEIEPGNIHWIGVGATLDRCEPFIVGVCKISDRREQIARKVLEAVEQREVANASGKTLRQKDVRAIPIELEVLTKDWSLGAFSFTIPYRVKRPVNLKCLIREKIIQRKGKLPFRRDEEWTDEGAASLLLCLAYLYRTDELCHVLEDLRSEGQGR